MKTKAMTSGFVVVILALLAAGAHAAGESLADAKTLFAAAAFEDALATLDHLEGATTEPEALEYRALCLMALGRIPEAQKVTEALVSAAPMFVPAETDLSPRFMTLFTDTRRMTLPAIAHRLFADARDQFHAKKTAEAQREFQQVMALASDPVWKDAPDAADLRTLASGFIDLVTASASPTPGTAAQQSRNAAAPSVIPGAVNPTPGKGAIQPPVVVSQLMPKWEAPDLVSAQRTFYGSIRIRIGTQGQVVDAAIQTPTHPLYDQLLLEAARNWVYRPAIRNGEPIQVEKVVTYQLKAK